MASTRRDWRAESKVAASSSSTSSTSVTTSSWKSERRQQQEVMHAEESVSSMQETTSTATTSSASASTAIMETTATSEGSSVMTKSASKSVEKKATMSISSAGLGIGLANKPADGPKAITAGAASSEPVPTSQRNGTATHKSSIKVAINQNNAENHEEKKQDGKERSESPPPLECEKEAGEKKKKDKRRKKKKDRSGVSGKESIRTEGARRIIKSHIDRDKVAKKFNKVTPEDMGSSMCHMCGKQVFQMEQVKAERAVWHRSCFRCKECQKQLTVDTYQSHEGELYCKPHFKQLFQPKVVLDEEDEAIKRRPRLKNEMIICESEPMALPEDVVRCSDKPDYGLDELIQVADVKSKFKAFENWSQQENQENTPSTPVKRSASILKQIARFQRDDGAEYSEEEEEEEEEDEENEENGTDEGENNDSGALSKKKKKKMVSAEELKFDQVHDIKNKWEGQHMDRKGVNAEKRKEEQIRVRQLMLRGKNESVKAMYQAQIEQQQHGDGQNKRNSVIIEAETNAKSIMEKFEKGELDELNADAADKRKSVADIELFTAADTAKKAKNLFKQIDATAASNKGLETQTLPRQKSISEKRWTVSPGTTAKADADIVRSSDIPSDAVEMKVDTHDIASKFKFFEAYKAPERNKREFRFTPPREGQVLENQEDEPEQQPEEKPTVAVVRSDTARKMLSKFREMEEKAIREQMYEEAGPKPLKSFTPPPEEYTDDDEDYSGSEYEDEEDEDDEEYEDDFEDEALKEAMRARRAHSLREKFEQWDDVAHKNQMNTALLEESETLPSLDTTKNLRAKFESLQKDQQATQDNKPKVCVNRFV